jgi:hypothetical protein
MAMESLTYDRGAAYGEELPPKEYETWQPKKLLAVLLEVDPNADKDSTLAAGVEPTYGQAPEVMQLIGSEKVLNLTTLKKHYDALGNYLHVPTLKQQLNDTAVNHADFKKRCEELSFYLSEVLSSRVWNAVFGNFATADCSACGKRMHKRFPSGVETIATKCFECGAPYKVREVGNGQVQFEPDQVRVECANPDCKTAIYPWRNEIEAGRAWTCPECKGRNSFRLGIVFEPKASGKIDSAPGSVAE